MHGIPPFLMTQQWKKKSHLRGISSFIGVSVSMDEIIDVLMLDP